MTIPNTHITYIKQFHANVQTKHFQGPQISYSDIVLKLFTTFLGGVYMNPDWVSIGIELIPFLLRS